MSLFILFSHCESPIHLAPRLDPSDPKLCTWQFHLLCTSNPHRTAPASKNTGNQQPRRFLSLRANSLLQDRKQAGLPTYAFFVDIKKAFDTADHNAMLLKLNQDGVCGSLWNVVSDLYQKGRAHVRVNGCASESYHVQQGVAQGCSLSPLLYNIFMDDLLRSLHAAGGLNWLVSSSVRKRMPTIFCALLPLSMTFNASSTSAASTAMTGRGKPTRIRAV